MASVDVPVALLGYGTVGAAVDRFLTQGADEIERATGHRLRVVRDPVRERSHHPADGVLTTDFADIRDDPSIALVAEVMGGLDPTGGYVLELLRTGKPVVTANKQLVARRGAELFAAAAEAGVQLRFEASVCAAIPVIKVLRESLVVSNVHRVLGIVNGTTNFMLTRMAEGASYEDALDEAQRLGYAEADPTEDVSGADAAAKVAILATVAFGTRVVFDDVDYAGIDALSPAQVDAARRLELVPRLIGSATLVDDRVDVRVRPSLVDRRHPLASVEGAFNAVMLQGDAIREITLEGPGAGGNETASAVIADLVSIVGTSATGFLQDDAVWRDLERLPPGALRSPFAVQLDVDDRPGVLAEVTRLLAAHELSVARLIQDPTPDGATLHVVLHEAPEGDVLAALEEIAALPESRGRPSALPVVSDRGVAGMGWA
jgi:homoserine dehydrogenase